MTLSTWMPLYWGDYAKDTGHLNAVGHGAYLMLIKHYWCTGAPLTNDDDELWRIACCDSKKEWLKLKPKVVRLFTPEDGKLHHKRIDLEIRSAEANSQQKRAAANARWGKRISGDDAPAHADAYPDAHAADKNRICPSPSPRTLTKEGTAWTQSPREEKPAATAENGWIGWSGGKEMVGGTDWEFAWSRIVEAARIDLARWGGDDLPARRWLAEFRNLDPIEAAIRKVAERSDYSPPRTLAYFDKPVREACARSAA